MRIFQKYVKFIFCLQINQTLSIITYKRFNWDNLMNIHLEAAETEREFRIELTDDSLIITKEDSCVSYRRNELSDLKWKTYPHKDRIDLEGADGSIIETGWLDKENSEDFDCFRARFYGEYKQKKVKYRDISKKSILRRLLMYRPKLLRMVCLIAFLLLFVSLGQALIPYLSGKILFDDILLNTERPDRKTALLIIVALIAGTEAVSQTIMALIGILNTRMIASLTKDLKKDIYEAVVKSAMKFFDSTDTGDIIHRIYNDTWTIQMFFSNGLPYLFVNMVMVIFALIFLFSLNPLLTSLILIPVPLIVVILRKSFIRLDELHIRSHNSHRKVISFINQVFSNFALIKAFGRDRHERKLFKNLVQRSAQTALDTSDFRTTVFPGVEFILFLTGLIIWLVGIPLVRAGLMSFGTVISFTAYLGLIYNPVRFFSMVSDWYTEAMEGGKRIFEILDSEPEKEGGDIFPDDFSESLSLENVNFQYIPGEPVLKDINLKTGGRSITGIVGSSGAGKSTMVNLLSRLYHPVTGEIRLDDMPYKEINSEYFRRNCGVVLQNSYIFAGSIMDNIRFAMPDAGPEEVIRAAKEAKAHRFIINLPDGYNTRIGTGGHSLSGGEVQRLTIARAIILNPKLLILDEATSSLDTETEKEVQKALDKLVSGRTVFAIAHRLSTLSFAERIIVVENGRIVEAGTQDELVRKKGRYYALLEKQRENLKEIAGMKEIVQ